MPRRPRYSYPDALHHATLRCNNKEFLFDPQSFLMFVHVLQDARAKFPLRLHDYCLMTNHVHLLFSVGHAETLSQAMHWISSRFSRRFNAARGRNGHLWEGRFRSTIVSRDACALRCMAYVDLNPVRAHMVSAPGQYEWSGHRAVCAEDRSVIDPLPSYLGIARTAEQRRKGYLAIIAEEAKRPPLSLATVYFVGRAEFIRRMKRKFGVREHPSVRAGAIGGGAYAFGPQQRTSGAEPPHE